MSGEQKFYYKIKRGKCDPSFGSEVGVAETGARY